MALKVFYLSPEVAPFSNTYYQSILSRKITTRFQDNQDIEIRVLHPKYGFISERKYILREVIRLKDFPIQFDDEEKLVSIKSAFIPETRVQIYFLEDELYFKPVSELIYKARNGRIYRDNAEKFALFAKVALETLIQLLWVPDVIVCNDWQSAFLPYLFNEKYRNDDPFKKTKTVSVFIIFIIVASILLFNFSKKELLPMEDRGAYLVIGFTDEGSSFEYTQEKAQVIEKRLIPLLQAENSPYSRFIMRVPGFGSSATSYNSFIIIALLDHWKNRKQDSQTVMRQAIGKIVTVPQAVAFPISPQSIRVSSYNKPVQMVIYGSTYEELERIQSEVIGKLRRNNNLSRLESDYTRNKPEVKLIINKNKAKDLGVSTETIGKSLETLYGGKRVTTFNKLGKEYPIILQQYLSDRRNKEGISKIFVRSDTTGKLISLTNLVNFKEEGTAKELARYNRQRAVTISANISENYTLSEAIKYLENTMAEVSPQSQITWKGKSEEIKETSNELFIIFALALLTAYLVMAATFNSFIHPFIIILTVPLAIFGGLVFILFLNSSINIFSQIALVILIGISTKNSILIVDYANQIRTTGKNIETAVKEACSIRFRPIIMTSLSTMIAMMPLVIGNIGPGAGEGSRLAVGATILGGMIISTFFTLYVTPTMYLALAKNTKRIDAIDLELNRQLKR